MFDSLKEKLGAFKDEAEEAAEEKAAAADTAEEAGDPEGKPPASEGQQPPSEGNPTAPEGQEADPPGRQPGPGPDGEDRQTSGPRGGPGPAPETGEGEVRAEIVPEDAPADESDAEGHVEGVPEDAPAEAGDGAEGHAEVVPGDAQPEGVVPDDAPPEEVVSEDAPAGDEAEAAFHAEVVPAEEEPADGGTGVARKAKSLAKGRFVIEEEDLEDPLWELEMALLESDVEMSVAEEILENLREELVGETRTFRESTAGVVEDALRSALLEVIRVGQFDFDERVREADRPVVIVFTGVNGVGKTTTIAKLARYFEERDLSVVLANGDTYRAGANEQIEEHADRLGKKLITHQQGGDPAAVIYDAVEYAEANDVDVVLGDTAGRLHTDEDLMEQLAKIHRVVDPDMTLFVDEAVAGQDAVRRAREFDEAAEIDGAVLAKADADAQGGAAISIAHVTGKPILFLGTGQGYDDLVRFDPDWMVDQLLGEG